ncbi:hypothetical protein [Mammaliicoccus sp. P-M59]|nr:hypothetical protein [Mammaliicoccus sp. P-M59]
MKNKIVRNSNAQETETRSLAGRNFQKMRGTQALTIKSVKQDR